MSNKNRPGPLGGTHFSATPDEMVDLLDAWWDEGESSPEQPTPVIYREAMERLMELTEALAGHPEANTSNMARVVLADIELVRHWLRRH